MSRLHNRFGSKLTLDDAEGIRRSYVAGEAVEALAARHGTTRNSIYEVLRGHSHVPMLVVRLDSATYARLRSVGASRGVADLEDLSPVLVEAGLRALEECPP